MPSTLTVESVVHHAPPPIPFHPPTHIKVLHPSPKTTNVTVSGPPPVPDSGISSTCIYPAIRSAPYHATPRSRRHHRGPTTSGRDRYVPLLPRQPSTPRKSERDPAPVRETYYEFPGFRRNWYHRSPKWVQLVVDWWVGGPRGVRRRPVRKVVMSTGRMPCRLVSAVAACEVVPLFKW
ncbi:hypothetical protein BJ508DRAFT_97629 [Ascobolus immersus RN42]|uniref:Uncharacterized protein n=1 Tax=Ascobolus immersus RN42 TaxID=1160509 RepID=A0A3N4IST2_ASCIM|nr:hypothetical protein BJ508DRAFT_97629 [Ascobolus immersus RN42]